MLRALVIDDEPDAHKLLEFYCHKSERISIAGHCMNAMEALQWIELNEADVLLLDINMPEITGMQLLGLLKKPIPVIFTTAYQQHALEAYEYEVIDYLLKPIKYERFIKAIEKTERFLSTQHRNLPKTVRLDKTDINPADFIYLEASGNYIKLHRSNKSVLMVHETMKIATEMLEPFGFLRCHKTFLVNKQFIDDVDTEKCILKNGISIPIGISYRQQIKTGMKR
jgi:DNA-binding LytR/AlgR family response regulator